MEGMPERNKTPLGSSADSPGVCRDLGPKHDRVNFRFLREESFICVIEISRNNSIHSTCFDLPRWCVDLVMASFFEAVKVQGWLPLFQPQATSTYLSDSSFVGW